MSKHNHPCLTAVFAVYVLLNLQPLAKAEIPGLTYKDTIDLSPGTDAYRLQLMQLNHSSHKLYVTGYPADGSRNLGLKVIDTTSNSVIGGIDLGRYTGDTNWFRPLGFAIDESASPSGNKIYMVGSANVINARLRVIDGTTDTNLTGEGTDLFLPVDEFDSVAVNSANHKVYIANDDGTVVVVDGPSRTVLTTLHPNAGNLLVANPVTNKVFVVNRNGGAMIDSSDDTFTSLVLPFYAFDAVVNPNNGMIYFAGTAQSPSYQVFAVDGNTGQLVTSSQGRPETAQSITYVPTDNTVRMGTQILQQTGYYLTSILDFDGTDLSPKGSLPQSAVKLACDPVATNGLFLLHDSEQPGDLRNMVGALNPSSGAMQKIATGYRPFEFAMNNHTNRAYLTDEQTSELLVIDSASHAVISRIPILPTQTPSGETPVLVTRFAGVSERLNRVYLLRTPPDSNEFPPTQFLDVFDGETNQFRESIALEPGFLYLGNLIAIDDARHRIYLHRANNFNSTSAQQYLIAYDTDTQAVVTSVDLGTPIAGGALGLAVNPVTGRVYDSGGAQGLAIIDGNTDTLVGTVPVRGDIKINRRTNKIFVKTSDGTTSLIAVIDGAIDSLQTSFPIQSDDNSLYVVDFDVDEVTNRVYVAHASDYSNGRLAAYNGNDGYQLLGQTDLEPNPVRIAFSGPTRQIFVSNHLDGNFSVFQADDTLIPADLFWNISTRGRVSDGDSALIGGFVITGTQPKTVIVRGIGPSLAVAGALADPIIEVHGASGELVATNDNWRDADSAPQIMASGFAPANDLEPALWGVINPGAYTVVVRGKNATTGVALFEVYDLDQGVDSKLGNVSTRGNVEVGDNVMIAGMIVLGTRSGQVVVRAIGPSLAAAGVANPLEDPVLELRDTNGGLITVNDDWQEHQAEVIGTSLAPTDPRESAIVASLYPGSYTAIVHGKNNATGVAVVEAYYLTQ